MLTDIIVYQPLLCSVESHIRINNHSTIYMITSPWMGKEVSRGRLVIQGIVCACEISVLHKCIELCMKQIRNFKN